MAVKKKPDEEPCLRIGVGDKVHVFWPLRVTPRIAATVRAQTGTTVAVFSRQVMDRDKSGSDTVAALAWVARLQAGEDVTYEAVLDEFPDSGRMPALTVAPDSEPIEPDNPQ